MKRLWDDPLSPQIQVPTRTLIVMARSGQIEKHHLSKARALKIVDRGFALLMAWIAGLLLGYLWWGWR